MANDKPERVSDEPATPAVPQTDREGEGDSLIPAEILENLAPEQRSHITRSFASMTQFATSAFSPVLQRITSDHITQIINNVEAQSNRESESEKASRRYQLVYFIVTLAALLFLLVFFTVRERFDILTSVITGIAGLGAGFGIGKFTNRR